MIPSQVLYYNSNNVPQVVLCEQIKTVAINDLQTYLGYLSEDIMSKVDNALRVQLDLDQPVTEKTTDISEALHFIESSFENLLKSKIEKKDTISDEQIGVTAMKIAKMIDNLTTPEKTEKVKDIPPATSSKEVIADKEEKVETPAPIPPTTPTTPNITSRRNMSQIDKFNAKYGRVETPSSATPKKSVKGKRFSSDNDRKEFLEDCKKLPLREVCTKWNMEPKDVYNHKYLSRKKLGM